MKKNINWLLALTCCSVHTMAQVQVSKEPFHRPVFVNKYIRLLDVVLQPNDTTQFHVHSTPSLFIYLSKNNTASQVNGKDWVNEQSVPGKTWYRSFSPDILIHRVANLDSVPFHVNDIEILSAYDSTNQYKNKQLSFSVIFENEKAIAYQITNQNIHQKIDKPHGPLIIELVAGDGIFFHDLKTKRSKEIKAGKYLYIEPDTQFYFTKINSAEINMVLFEIK